MTLEEHVRNGLLAAAAKAPTETLQDLVFAIGLVITDHAFALIYRLW